MLQNAKVTALILSELLRENQQGAGKITPSPHHPTQIRVKENGKLQNYFWPGFNYCTEAGDEERGFASERQNSFTGFRFLIL